MAAEFDSFLGAAPRFPFRVGNAGLPELDFTQGEPTVKSVVEFLLLTSPGDLPFDPGLGLDPELLRHNPIDVREAEEVQARIRASLVDAEPRMTDVRADVTLDPEANILDVNITYRVIEQQVPGNLVVTPQQGHGDVTRVTDTSAEALIGFHDPKLLGIQTG